MFNRKPRPEPPQPTAPIERDAYLRETNSIIDQLLAAKPAYIGNYPQAETWIKDTLEALRKTIGSIDFNNLTNAEKTRLANVLTKIMTKMFNKVARENTSQDLTWMGLSDRICGKANKARKEILNVCLTQQARARSQAINIDTTTWQQQITTGATSDQPTRITFPAFTTPDTNLQTAYNNLRDTWSSASLKDLSIEDAYTVTAIASNYLPDSIRIYQRLTHRSPQASSQGASLLTEQMNMMRSQLDIILNNDTSDALSEMRAQSSFLAGKTRPATEIP